MNEGTELDKHLIKYELNNKKKKSKKLKTQCNSLGKLTVTSKELIEKINNCNRKEDLKKTYVCESSPDQQQDIKKIVTDCVYESLDKFNIEKYLLDLKTNIDDIEIERKIAKYMQEQYKCNNKESTVQKCDHKCDGITDSINVKLEAYYKKLNDKIKYPDNKAIATLNDKTTAMSTKIANIESIVNKYATTFTNNTQNSNKNTVYANITMFSDLPFEGVYISSTNMSELIIDISTQVTIKSQTGSMIVDLVDFTGKLVTGTISIYTTQCGNIYNGIISNKHNEFNELMIYMSNKPILPLYLPMDSIVKINLQII